MNKSKKIQIAAVLILIIAVVLFFTLRSGKKDMTFSKVEVGNMIEATYAVGTVKADKVFNLKTGVNTKMIERFVRIGQKVKKGQPLVRLDSFPVYTAPFDGVITVLNYEVGELVFSSSIVLTLVNEKQLYLELSLDERSINKIRIGNDARISFENQKKKTTGRVRSIFSNAEQFYVHVDFDESDIVLLPGMTCDVSLITRKFDNATLVPLEAIDFENSVKIKGDPKKSIKLEIEYRDDKYAVVKNEELKNGIELINPSDRNAPGFKKAKSK